MKLTYDDLTIECEVGNTRELPVSLGWISDFGKRVRDRSAREALEAAARVCEKRIEQHSSQTKPECIESVRLCAAAIRELMEKGDS